MFNNSRSRWLTYDPVGLLGCTTTTARVLGVNRLSQRVKIDLPAVIVEQWVGYEVHVLEVGEKLKQRIARFGHQNFIAGIAQQAKDVGIAFAGAGREHYRFRIDFKLPPDCSR